MSNKKYVIIEYPSEDNQIVISYHRPFVRLTGGITEAITLSQAVHFTINSDDDGWFHLTADEWEKLTGIQPYYQQWALTGLSKFHFWEQEYYSVSEYKIRVNLTELEKSLWELGLRSYLSDSNQLTRSSKPISFN